MPSTLALREHLPLQQGLRPSLLVYNQGLFFLREHLPLQQGLRRVLHTA